jgi:ATP-dependent DNA ligase
VRFRRAAGMLPLPVLQRGGLIEALAAFLNLPAPDEFMLVAGWLLATLQQGGPYPLLVIAGEQESAKTMLTKILRALIDPNAAPTRAPPRRVHRAVPPNQNRKLPSGGQWLHEIKHDGFSHHRPQGWRPRAALQPPGNDMTRRFPRIVEALARLRSRSCIIDGEAVACDDNGVALFDLIRHATTTVSSSCVPPRRRDAFISRVCSESVVRADS